MNKKKLTLTYTSEMRRNKNEFIMFWSLVITRLVGIIINKISIT